LLQKFFKEQEEKRLEKQERWNFILMSVGVGVAALILLVLLPLFVIFGRDHQPATTFVADGNRLVHRESGRVQFTCPEGQVLGDSEFYPDGTLRLARCKAPEPDSCVH
jgi:hypothetical protein